MSANYISGISIVVPSAKMITSGCHAKLILSNSKLLNVVWLFLRRDREQYAPLTIENQLPPLNKRPPPLDARLPLQPLLLKSGLETP